MIQSKSARGHVHVIVGENVGKTLFTEYLEHEELALLIPPVSAPSDVMGWCMYRGPADCYVFDYPYAIQRMRSGFWNSISSLKEGYLFAKKKGKMKELHFDPPTVIIFFGPRTTHLRQEESTSCHILEINKENMRLEEHMSFGHHQIKWDAHDKKWNSLK
jgi:hypothetical protein